MVILAVMAIELLIEKMIVMVVVVVMVKMMALEQVFYVLISRFDALVLSL